MMRVRCINAKGSNCLTEGKVYMASYFNGTRATYRIFADDEGLNQIGVYGKDRFEDVVFKVKCLDASQTRGLTVGKTYEAVHAKTPNYLFVLSDDAGYIRVWYECSRFEILKSEEDAPTLPSIQVAAKVKNEHTEMLDFFRPVASNTTCGKCGAGIPCKYH